MPGLHPTMIRSLSFPDTNLRQVPEETNEETSREPLPPRHYHGTPEELGTEPSDKAVRRRSSMILLHNLEGLGITSGAEWRKSFKAYRLTPSGEQDDKPPQVPPKSPRTGCGACPKVPPKSPRTEKRAFPRPRRKPLHSATSSVSTACSTSSAEASVSSKSSMCVPISVEGLISNAASNSIKKISAEPLTCLYDGGMRTPARKVTPRSQPCNPRSDEQDRSNEPLELAESSWYRESLVSTDEAPESKEEEGVVDSLQWHAQRRILEPSVIDNGRPIQRGDTSLMHNLSKLMIRRSSLTSKETVMPTGTKVREASDNLPSTDLSILRQLANERVEGFEVLSMEDLSNLSKVCITVPLLRNMTSSNASLGINPPGRTRPIPSTHVRVPPGWPQRLTRASARLSQILALIKSMCGEYHQAGGSVGGAGYCDRRLGVEIRAGGAQKVENSAEAVGTRCGYVDRC